MKLRVTIDAENLDYDDIDDLYDDRSDLIAANKRLCELVKSLRNCEADPEYGDSDCWCPEVECTDHEKCFKIANVLAKCEVTP